MTLTRADNYRRVLAALREHCPTLLPVKVRRVRLPRAARCVADCTLEIDRKGRAQAFVIRVSSKLPWLSATDALVHEWAHALSFTTQHPSFQDHGPEWGLAMSRCYLVVEGARPVRRAR